MTATCHPASLHRLATPEAAVPVPITIKSYRFAMSVFSAPVGARVASDERVLLAAGSNSSGTALVGTDPAGNPCCSERSQPSRQPRYRNRAHGFDNVNATSHDQNTCGLVLLDTKTP